MPDSDLAKFLKITNILQLIIDRLFSLERRMEKLEAQQMDRREVTHETETL